jgi:hypothetical protein
MMITHQSKRVIPFRAHDAKRVGEGCFYLDQIVWLNGDRIELGDRVTFNFGCFVNGFGGLVFHDGANIGPVLHAAHGQPQLRRSQPAGGGQGWQDVGPMHIGRNSWIGMGSVVLPGVTIGEGCVVGAAASSRAISRVHRRGRQSGQGDQEPAVMRVLFLHQQPCMRALKYAVGLRSAGAPLELGFAYRGRTLSEFYGTGDELFDHWWRIGPDLRADLRRVIAEWKPDLIHSHNLPDLLTVLALEVTEGRVPVIHDVHDMQSLRHTPYEDGFPDAGDPAGLEQAAVEGSAALITVSDELLGELADRYELPGPHADVRQLRARAGSCPPRCPPRTVPPATRRDSSTRARCPAAMATTTCARSSRPSWPRA